jgi:hypothetical protein
MRRGKALRRAWLTAVLTAAVGACGPDPVDLPSPPLEAETAAVAVVYDAPTGTINTERLAQLLAEIQARLDDLELDWLPDQIGEALTRLRRRFDEAAFPVDPAAAEDADRADLRAVVYLTRICSGWAEAPGPPNLAENGSLELTAVVDEGRLRPEIWGIATACRTRIHPLDDQGVPGLALNALLNGTLIALLYGPLPREVGEAEFLFRFQGEIGPPEKVRALSFDFRIVGANVEFRHGVADGDIVVGVGIGIFTLRGRNGTFTCDLALQSCA